jgi:hypothetical protein
VTAGPNHRQRIIGWIGEPTARDPIPHAGRAARGQQQQNDFSHSSRFDQGWLHAVQSPPALANGCRISHMTRTITGVAAVVAAAFASQAFSQTPSLDFEFFKTRVQPILLLKRPGHARCYVCHSTGTTFRIERLSQGATTWNDEQSKRNFDSVKRLVVPGDPLASKLLTHPLAPEGGGDQFHSGGKHWSSQDDPEWKTLAAWVNGKKP